MTRFMYFMNSPCAVSEIFSHGRRWTIKKVYYLYFTADGIHRFRSVFCWKKITAHGFIRKPSSFVTYTFFSMSWGEVDGEAGEVVWPFPLGSLLWGLSWSVSSELSIVWMPKLSPSLEERGEQPHGAEKVLPAV